MHNGLFEDWPTGWPDLDFAWVALGAEAQIRCDISPLTWPGAYPHTCRSMKGLYMLQHIFDWFISVNNRECVQLLAGGMYPEPNCSYLCRICADWQICARPGADPPRGD